jgi:CBS domain-containing protein
MTEHNCGSVLVLGADGGLVGIFTERDLLVRVVAPGRDPAADAVSDVMTREPETIGVEASVREAVRRMDEGAFRHLPVVERGRVVGVLSARDIPVLEFGRMADELDSRHRLAERLW